MIPCPTCGSTRVRGHEDVYGPDSDVVYVMCRDCDEGFDVRITSEGVELAPITYVPGIGGIGA